MKLFILKGFLLLPLILFSQIEKQVLFIGNSYTYMNGLPELINQIAISKGNSLIYESHTPGGSTLIQHASNSNVQSLLNATEWDLSYLSNGIYTILLTQKNGQQKSLFWIKKN